MTTRSILHETDRGSVRAGDPTTSQWAADSITDATTSQGHVLRLVREHAIPIPFTLEDVADATAGVMSPSRSRTAVRELMDRGLIEDTGRTAVVRSGRRARLLAPVEGVAA